ncbi:D(2) dopamine receptor-like, partial [Leucoraja erinacea]|uniref:D(2) dopamine receptor-like n=1 Tax=Leucoraja erinaceus TaxID=7782 RepID=UPI002453973E
LSDTRNDATCLIHHPEFVVYSSIFSFFIPFIITLLVYVQIYVVLRKRRKRVNTKRSSRFESEIQAPLKDKCTHPEDVKLCTVIVKSNGSFPTNKRKVVSVYNLTMALTLCSHSQPPELQTAGTYIVNYTLVWVTQCQLQGLANCLFWFSCITIS